MTAFSAVAASINNLGPGLAGGRCQPMPGLNDPAKWILCFAMLLGRLEIFTLAGAAYACFLAKIIDDISHFRAPALLPVRYSLLNKRLIIIQAAISIL